PRASPPWLRPAPCIARVERGGTAVGPSVAVGFASQIVEPNLNGPGGDLPAIVYSAERDDVVVICAQGTAPAAATVARFRELDLDLIPGTGLLPAVVPGAFDGWLLMLREFGTWTLGDVLDL